MLVSDQLKAEANAMFQRGNSFEDIMHFLREQGVSLIGTMSVIVRMLPEPSISTARDIVLNSAAWGDHKEAFWDFQNMFWDALDKADEEESAKSI